MLDLDFLEASVKVVSFPRWSEVMMRLLSWLPSIRVAGLLALYLEDRDPVVGGIWDLR
jgi:hypothetical protein